ncbi:two-component system response regulator [Desulfuribacillus stibiiarsenatis]|uniref:Two-component system response regulator n=1 Tax=Desulfuribacillus stibiiarsenatis TaxID=1390249 RepID=A0A1E5L669_9FIRM|nr:response regulator [Desulfuribacillus stibiiarsenatis]OEH85625.1 two-component system response regulator [Desulfuribacillus stibiiarsenatis]
MNKLIFIVDDSRTVRASLEYTLKKDGYEVIAAEDGQDGLNKINQLNTQGKRPAMIISDINMPNLDGIGFITEVKKIPSMKFIPVLVLTTESQEEKKMEGKKAGAAGWLVKPFQPEQLIAVVKKFVK